MIHEYALEPELVASWHDPLEFRFFVEQFGFRTGRVVSRYPKKWKKLVWDAFNTTSGNTASPVARTRMTTLLKRLTEPGVKRLERVWDEDRDWLVNAEIGHERRPFHAILARDNPRAYANVIREADILADTVADWDVPHTRVVKRTAEEMAACVAPMLCCATKILFVDPHFRATEERFRKPLSAFLRVVEARASEITLELHTADRADKPSWTEFQKECDDKLPPVLPAGMPLSVYRWKEREGGEKLHNRYILTDIGGVQFGVGLDEGEPGTTDDIARLSVDTFRKRFEDYAGPNSAFDQDGEPFSVEGQANS